ncbi:hypothetical protein AX767_00145 [Variovorax sp. PAMC 28711]|nr:hypothetical protein AX767_00145 [Variovorax sp. PAMC 28711]
MQLDRRAGEFRIRIDRETQPMAQRREPARQPFGFVFAMRQQRPHPRPLRRRRRRTAFQPRQRQQVVDQRLHAGRLLRHQREVARALFGIERQRLQRFDEAGEHRQRRANFVRHVGHKIAAHGFCLLERRDVARQQHAAVARVRMHLHRQAGGMVAPRHPLCRGVDQHVTTVVPRSEVSDENRVAHEVGQVLQEVALDIDAELRRSRLVAPLDTALRVEQHHAIGGRLDRREKFLKAIFGLSGLLFAGAQQLADAFGQFAPHTRTPRRQRRRVVAQDMQQALRPPGVEREPGQCTHPCARPDELGTEKARSDGCASAGRYQKRSNTKGHPPL